MLSHVEEVGKAPLPDEAELDSLRSNVAKQQQKVDQLTSLEPSANGAEVPHPHLPATFIIHPMPLFKPWTAGIGTKPASCIGVCPNRCHVQVIRGNMHLPMALSAVMPQHSFYHL